MNSFRAFGRGNYGPPDSTGPKARQTAMLVLCAGNGVPKLTSRNRFLLGVAPFALAAASAAWADSSNSNPGLTEVVVTARHRTENAAKVPVAITVLKGSDLARNKLYNLNKIQQEAPSLQIQGVNPRNQTITIRGLGANPGLTTEGFEQGVGTYIDGVYYARTAITLFDLFDLDRVEVLRGPQGTLFGKNTTAGALNIVTREPAAKRTAEVELSYGNYNLEQGHLLLSGPISDTLGASLTLGDTKQQSTYRSYQSGKPFKGLENASARGQVVYKPNEDLKIRLLGDYNRQDVVGATSDISSILPTTLADGTTKTGFYQHAAAAGYTPLPINPWARTSDINSYNHWAMKTGGVSGQGDYNLNGFTLSSISAYRYFNIRPNYDADGTGATVFQTLGVNISQQQVSQELRLASPTGQAIEYTGGLYYFWQQSVINSFSIYGNQAEQFLYGAANPAAILTGVDQFQHYNPAVSSESAYGHATWHVTPRFDVIAGARYTYEDKTGTLNAYDPGNITPIADLPAAYQTSAAKTRNALAPTLNYSPHWSGGAPSGTFGVSYQITDKSLAYATYSRGFQAAGLNLAGAAASVPKVVAPEYVNSYEAGLKSTFFNNRIQFNESLFWSDVSNFQATVFDSNLNTTYIANAGNVRSRGAEFEARAVPLNGLSTSFAVTYDDATYQHLEATSCPYLYSDKTSCNLSGEPLAGVSRWAISASADYSYPVTEDYEIYTGGNYLYRSSYYSQFNDDQYSRIPGYGVLNLHLGFRPETARWDVELWSNNISNKRYFAVLSPTSSTGIVGATLGDPRTYGLTLKLKY